MRFFEETLVNLKHVFKVVPARRLMICTPAYMSTRMLWPQESSARSECSIIMPTSPAVWRRTICVAVFLVLAWPLDGTGFGTDGRIWGGEFLLADFAGFARRAHLRNVFASPGGNACGAAALAHGLSYLRMLLGRQLTQ